jgi:hypothetical protein
MFLTDTKRLNSVYGIKLNTNYYDDKNLAV